MMEDKIVSYKEFEDAVMQKLLEKDTSVNRILREQYKRAQVTSRDFTGAGFFTDLAVPDDALRVTDLAHAKNITYTEQIPLILIASSLNWLYTAKRVCAE